MARAQLAVLIGTAALLAFGLYAVRLGGVRFPAKVWLACPGFALAMLLLFAAQRVLTPNADPSLIPAAGLLNGLGLVLLARLDPTQAMRQTVWLLLGAALAVVAMGLLSHYSRLRRYPYLAAAAGLGLLLFAALLGTQVHGSRLWFRLGPLNVQVVELLKLCSLAFVAGYLADRGVYLRALSRRWRNFRLPTWPYLVPLLLVWLLTLALVALLRDFGAAALVTGVALAMLYAASGRRSLLIGGAIALVAALAVAYLEFGYVRVRVDTWLHPFANPTGAGYQLSQGLFAIANGGVLGAGLGYGHPTLIPVVSSDFIFNALVEELGIAAGAAVIGTYVLLVARGMRVALRSWGEYARLLAVGATLTIGLQALVIIAGDTAVMPVTGVPLPFVSYGGSSLLVNFVLLALLLRLSDDAERLRAVEPET